MARWLTASHNERGTRIVVLTISSLVPFSPLFHAAPFVVRFTNEATVARLMSCCQDVLLSLCIFRFPKPKRASASQLRRVNGKLW